MTEALDAIPIDKAGLEHFDWRYEKVDLGPLGDGTPDHAFAHNLIARNGNRVRFRALRDSWEIEYVHSGHALRFGLIPIGEREAVGFPIALGPACVVTTYDSRYLMTLLQGEKKRLTSILVSAVLSHHLLPMANGERVANVLFGSKLAHALAITAQ